MFLRAILNYNRRDRGLPGGTPGTTTIIICTTWCARRYISRVRSFRVLIFMYWAKVSSWYYDGRSCSICTRCFHRCSARIPTITAIVVCIPIKPPFFFSSPNTDGNTWYRLGNFCRHNTHCKPFFSTEKLVPEPNVPGKCTDAHTMWYKL